MSELSELQRPLPLSEEKQRAVLGHLLVNDRFWNHLAPYVEIGWFSDAQVTAPTFKLLRNFRERWHRAPSVNELKGCSELLCEPPQTQARIRAEIDQALLLTQTYGLDVLSHELTVWMQARVMRVASAGVEAAFGRKKVDDAVQLFKQAAQDLDAVRINEDPSVDWEDFASVFEKRKAELGRGLTWGVDLMDRLLCPEATDGGLIVGDATLLVGATNAGKTSTVRTIALANVLKGRPGILVAHEGKETDLYTDTYCTLLRVSRSELMRMYESEDGRARLSVWAKLLKKYLDFIHLPRAGLAIEKFIPLLRRKNDERIARTGEGYMWMADDYPGCLTTEKASRGHWEVRHITDYVYEQWTALGLELNIHSLAMIQSNREGAKINQRVNREGRQRLLMATDVSEASGATRKAQNVVTINREAGVPWVTYYIDKCKSNEPGSGAGYAVICKSDMGHGVTHGNDLGATYYRSNSNVADRALQMLDQFKGGQVPDAVVHQA